MHVEWRTIEPGQRELLLVADTVAENVELAMLVYALAGGVGFCRLTVRSTTGEELLRHEAGVGACSVLPIRDANLALVHKLLAERWR